MAIKVGNLSSKMTGNQDALGMVKDLVNGSNKANPLKTQDNLNKPGLPGITQDQTKFAEFIHQQLGNKMTQVNLIV